MASYGFDYTLNGSRPSKVIEAANDREAYQKIAVFLKEKGGILVTGSVRAMEYRTVPDPEPKLEPGEYNLAAAQRNGIRMPGMSILEG